MMTNARSSDRNDTTLDVAGLLARADRSRVMGRADYLQLARCLLSDSTLNDDQRRHIARLFDRLRSGQATVSDR